MNCAEVNVALGPDAPPPAPNRAAIRGHLESCPDCRSAYPEVVWLLDQQRSRRPANVPVFRRPRKTGGLVLRWAAAAAVVATLAWVGLQALSVRPGPGESRREDAPIAEAANAAPRGFVAGDLGTITYQSLSIHRDRQDTVTSITAILPATRSGGRSHSTSPR